MNNKKITIGIVAHVDSGKTTMGEAMLYNAGKIRTMGRVDRKSTFLDNNSIERDRGITVFSKQAVFETNGTTFFLIDTPGHADFGAEAERTLSVLDYAILVVSATEGVQSHTVTLWNLLKTYNIPTFVFVNKLDIAFLSKEEIIENIHSKLCENCFDFSDKESLAHSENLAICSEEMMNDLFAGGIKHESILSAINERCIFPCFFGSALKNDGVLEFMHALSEYTLQKPYSDTFGAKVFKISFDETGNRLTHVKITSGYLNVKSILKIDETEEKVNEIRIYSGNKYESVPVATAGTVCVLTGPEETYPGKGLGCESDSISPILEPMFLYDVKLISDINNHDAYSAFKKLAQEETMLNVSWNNKKQKISVRLMGEVQTEVIIRLIKERFGFDVSFEQGGVVYKETILDTVEGVGHYEPLRHYAEVHLILSPAPKGSGVTFGTGCREDDLDARWQRLILTHLAEKEHIGVLTGSPITDINITLSGGKAHKKHTEGGDFREATYRAVRHGLKNAKSVLLEPWYNVRITVPGENTGRIMTDISNMGGSFSPPEINEDMTIINALAPANRIHFYKSDILSFTKGRGSITYTFRGYEPCLNEEEVIDEIGYDFDSDTENSADSVFCSHGAGYIVKWNEVYDNMHLPSTLADKKDEIFPLNEPRKVNTTMSISQEEIDRIFEMTYKKPQIKKESPKKRTGEIKYKSRNTQKKGEYILVDGYNIIFAWDDLRCLAKENIDLARNSLITRLVNYAAVRECPLTLVFDAYKVSGGRENTESINGITVVYTKEAETADSYIERSSHTLARYYQVRVATSDSLEQIIILGAGAMRTNADAFQKEVIEAERIMEEYLGER